MLKTPAAPAAQSQGKPLSIVHTVSSLKFGGLERFAVRLGSVQVRAGHRVAILALQGGALEEAAREAGIHVQVPSGSSRIERYARSVAFFGSWRPDVVHVHNPTSLHYAAAAKFVSRAKLVLTDHGQCAGIVRTPRRWELARTDALVSVSRDVAERHDLGAAHLTPMVILNGVEPSAPSKPGSQVRAELNLPAGFTGIVVARVDPVKDHENLLRALALLQDVVPVNLLVVGDGSERPRLEALVPALGLSPDRVRFLGFRTDVPDLIAASDFFVLPSLQEGLPLAMLEAMSQKLPVVATAVGGVPELISDGEHGLLVPCKSPEALAEAIRKLAADPNLRRRLGEAGGARVAADFSFDEMARRYLSLYEKLLFSRC